MNLHWVKSGSTARAGLGTAVRVAVLGLATGCASRDVRWVGHNGFAPGAFDQVDLYPDRRYSVVVLSNNDMSGAGAIAYRLRLLLTSR